MADIFKKKSGTSSVSTSSVALENSHVEAQGSVFGRVSKDNISYSGDPPVPAGTIIAVVFGVWFLAAVLF